MTKIVAVADLHGNLPRGIPECDLLIIAGDICPDYQYPASPQSIEKQSNWLHYSFWPFLKEQSSKQTIAVWGNHDFVGEQLTFPDNWWELLEDSEIRAGGLRIYGTPYTHRYYDWAFMETEAQLAERFARIPEGLDILVSHGPPLWVCDRPAGSRGDHVGSRALYDRLRTMQNPPKHLICGHIHGGRGWGTVFCEHGSVQVWNVAGVDENYSPHSPMWTELVLDDETKEVTLDGASV